MTQDKISWTLIETFLNSHLCPYSMWFDLQTLCITLIIQYGSRDHGGLGFFCPKILSQNQSLIPLQQFGSIG